MLNFSLVSIPKEAKIHIPLIQLQKRPFSSEMIAWLLRSPKQNTSHVEQVKVFEVGVIKGQITVKPLQMNVLLN